MALPRNVRRIKGPMEASVDAAIAQMDWLQPTDFAMVTLALTYGRQIDLEMDDAKVVGYLGLQLQGVLKALGGTPLERKALKSEGGGGGELAQLRAKRVARERAAKDLDDSAK